MNVFGNSSKQLLQALTANAEKETMDYVLQEMQAVLGEEMPETDAVRTYLQDPDKPTELSTAQQIVAMDKLLECTEVNLRTLCDLIRYPHCDGLRPGNNGRRRVHFPLRKHGYPGGNDLPHQSGPPGEWRS